MTPDTALEIIEHRAYLDYLEAVDSLEFAHEERALAHWRGRAGRGGKPPAWARVHLADR